MREQAPPRPEQETSRTVRQVALLFTVCLLAASPLAAVYTGEWGQVLPGFGAILFSASPQVTDYFRLGNLAAAFLNAGACGAVFTALMYLLPGPCGTGFWSGYFLVVAHCFFGLDLLNMWPPVLGVLLYCRVRRLSFQSQLPVAMYATAFGPFFSELLFRYPGTAHWVTLPGGAQMNLLGLLWCALLGAFLGFAVPAMLPGAQKLHRGFSLYNAGLGFGILGLLVYAFLYRTAGVTTEGLAAVVPENPVYQAHGCSYFAFCNGFFLVAFGLCVLLGWLMGGHSFSGYGQLLRSNSYKADFLRDHSAGLVWLNLGLCGLLVTCWFDLVVLLTEGAGFTGPTCGVTLAAVSFAASGQHPKNIWPPLAGYASLAAVMGVLWLLLGRQPAWSLSTQGYINGAAFATGLCPFAGCYGWWAGLLAGLLSATLCTTTSLLHGGLMLYNSGLTAGLAALLLLPLLDHYYKGPVNTEGK